MSEVPLKDLLNESLGWSTSVAGVLVIRTVSLTPLQKTRAALRCLRICRGAEVEG